MAEREFIGGVDVTGWGEADKAALRSAAEEREAAETSLATAEAARTAQLSAPATIIAEQKRAAEYAKNRALAAAELEKAQVAHGRDRVVAVPIVDGRAIILRAMTLAETDGAEQRAAQLANPAERLTVHREALLDSVVFPPRDEVKALAAKYAALWGVLYAARDSLIVGVEEDFLGKAAASTSTPAAR